jgi:hypothetical protein
MCGRIIAVKKKRRIAIRHPTEVRGDVNNKKKQSKNNKSPKLV